MRLTPKEQQTIYQTARDENKAFSVDYDYSAADVIFNVKAILPELEAISLGEKTVLGNTVEEFSVNDNHYRIDVESTSHVFGVIGAINKELAKTNQCFITLDSGGEDIPFMLIPLTELQSYLDQGFSKVQDPVYE